MIWPAATPTATSNSSAEPTSRSRSAASASSSARWPRRSPSTRASGRPSWWSAICPTSARAWSAYLTPAADVESVDVDRVRARVAAALPEYMTPAGYVVLDEIPITAHGKIDRAALPPPEILSGTEFRQPSAGTEQTIAELFAELLGREQVGADDSFFDLGGHSLLATKLVAAIRSRCGVDLGVREIFELGTVAQSGRAHRRRVVGRRGPVAVWSPSRTTDPARCRRPNCGSWFQYRIDGPSPVNNIPFAARLTGPCDVDALVAAVSDVVDRHEVLRTTYREIDGVPYQIVNPATGMPVRRARGDDEAVGAGRARDASAGTASTWSATCRSGPRCCRRRTSTCCRWSCTTSPRTTGRRRAVHRPAGRLPGRRAGQPPMSGPAARAVRRLRGMAGRVAGRRRRSRCGTARVLAAAAGRPARRRSGCGRTSRVRRCPSGEGDSVEFTIDADHPRQTRRISPANSASPSSCCCSRRSRSCCTRPGRASDIPLGTPVAGRTEAELDQLIGFFINIVVLRNDLSGNPTLRDVLRRAREMALAAYAHQDLPFDRVVDAVGPCARCRATRCFGVVVHVREALPAGQGHRHADPTATPRSPRWSRRSTSRTPICP